VIFLDSSIVYNALVDTELTKYARKVLESRVPKLTSDTAIDEVWFALLKKKAGVKSAEMLKKRIKRSDEGRRMPYDVLVKVFAFLQKHAVLVIPDSRDWAKIAQCSSKYGLLPHDARLVVTAVDAGASGFAALDADFAVISKEIKLLPENYWKGKV